MVVGGRGWGGWGFVLWEDDFVLGGDEGLLVGNLVAKLVSTAGEVGEAVESGDHEGEEGEAEAEEMVFGGRHWVGAKRRRDSGGGGGVGSGAGVAVVIVVCFVLVSVRRAKGRRVLYRIFTCAWENLKANVDW